MDSKEIWRGVCVFKCFFFVILLFSNYFTGHVHRWISSLQVLQNCSICQHLLPRRTWCMIMKSNDEWRLWKRRKYFSSSLLSSFFQSQFPYVQLSDNVDYHLLIQLFSSIEKSPSKSFHFPLVHHFDQMLGKTNSSLTPSNHPILNFHYQSTPNVALSFDDQVERSFSSSFRKETGWYLKGIINRWALVFFLSYWKKDRLVQRERVH